jgi:hypothetical protein
MSAIHEASSTLSHPNHSGGVADYFAIEGTPLDRRSYRALITARAETLRRVLEKLRPALRLSTALDAG